MNTVELKKFIAMCGCVTCRALKSLKLDASAKISISSIHTGRMCEIAVVGAAGLHGLTGDEVVARRAAYAKHLGVELPDGTRNNPTPFHIEHAIRFPDAFSSAHSHNGPIILGNARASKVGERYYLVWNAEPFANWETAPFARGTTLQEKQIVVTTHGIEIAWPYGVERIEIDLQNIGAHTNVLSTSQHIDDPAAGYPSEYRYKTTSSTTDIDGGFCLQIMYEHTANPHINEADSWWGRTTLCLLPGDIAGVVDWTHEGDSDSSGKYTFHAATWQEVVEKISEDDRVDQVRADEDVIECRDDLTPTEKFQLIKARRGQGIFRSNVLLKEPCCRLTGVDDPKHLRASHIKPWAASSDQERLDGDNGLMLAPHVDHLFDKACISFDDSGQLLVADDPAIHALLTTWAIDLTATTVPARPFNARQCKFLAKHRQRLADWPAG